MAEYVCSECTEDPYLKAIIQEEGSLAKCDECDEEQEHTISIEKLGEILAPIIEEHFQAGSDSPRFYDDSDNPSWEQDGEDLGSIVQQVLGQDFDFNDEIVDAVVASEHCDIHHGEEPFFDTDTNYIETPTSSYELRMQWAYVNHQLQTGRRFFSPAARELFNELFEDIDSVLTQNGSKSTGRSVVRELGSDFNLYRARKFESTTQLAQMLRAPYANVGPPQPRYASAGRMNAEGIPVFYGATDAETCLAELRPALGSTAVVITMKTSKVLRILDFTRMKTAYKTLSYFQPDFSDQVAKFAFIRSLATMISQPIVPGHESDYLITQTMMEYLAHEHPQPFDGVFFHSAQKQGGINVVLFPAIVNDEPVFPLTYVDDTIKTHTTKSIKYEHRETHYEIDGEDAKEKWIWGEEDE